MQKKSEKRRFLILEVSSEDTSLADAAVGELYARSERAAWQRLRALKQSGDVAQTTIVVCVEDRS